MIDLSKRVPLSHPHYLFSQALFVGKWAFYVFFVIPSVIVGGVLALYSNFSFQTIPREVLQFAAQTAANPPAQQGSLWIQVCKDKVPDHALPPSPICKSKRLEQRPIEALAREVGERLLWAYAVVVALAAGLAIVFGPFLNAHRGRRRQES
ncbi:hypothetical protein [Burkholderia pseudomultivorans]|uniref:hypothetical protein n=1 Tax=Burkholderia pseudomultivorans TaxID=1207504 RepID=UPI0018900527|nr:hypothetical protein [Burkholderia pseudomultivorans]MBF5008581.1 hypothetical protein [Burkholderia pseudomultivorans]